MRQDFYYLCNMIRRFCTIIFLLLAALPKSAGGWEQWDKPFAGKDDPQYARFLALVQGTIVPSKWHDIRGTCGRDSACECNSCWLRLGGFNDPKVIHGKSGR